MPTSGEPDEPPASIGSPVRAAVGCAGTGVVAAAPIAAGDVACRLVGQIVSLADVPQAELRHALWLDGDRWMIPQAPARYINHSCDPNCALADDPGDPDAALVVALRPIAAGEEITFAYDRIDADELAANAGNPAYAWHPAWTFNCACGAPICRGLIDGYRPVERSRAAPDVRASGANTKLHAPRERHEIGNPLNRIVRRRELPLMATEPPGRSLGGQQVDQ